MNLTPNHVLRLTKNAVKNTSFSSPSTFVKPTNYGTTTPAIIGKKNPIFVGFVPGDNNKTAREKFPIPTDENTVLLTSYVEQLKGTIFGLVTF